MCAVTVSNFSGVDSSISGFLINIIMLRNASRLVSNSSRQIARRTISASIVRTGGGGGGPMMPPFARLKPPTETVRF